MRYVSGRERRSAGLKCRAEGVGFGIGQSALAMGAP